MDMPKTTDTRLTATTIAITDRLSMHTLTHQAKVTEDSTIETQTNNAEHFPKDTITALNNVAEEILETGNISPTNKDYLYLLDNYLYHFSELRLTFEIGNKQITTYIAAQGEIVDILDEQEPITENEINEIMPTTHQIAERMSII